MTITYIHQVRTSLYFISFICLTCLPSLGAPVLNDTVYHILSTGQSLSVGYGGAPALSLTQPFNNLMLSRSLELVPLIEGTNNNNGVPASTLAWPYGPTVETHLSSLGNSLHTLNTSFQYIVTGHGIGGLGYQDIKKGTDWYNLGMSQVNSAMQAVRTAGSTYLVEGISLIHGETDHFEKSTSYLQNIIQFQQDYETDIKSHTGQIQNVPMFICQMSSQSIFENNWAVSRIPYDQLKAAEENPNFYLVTPKYFFAYSDGLHLTNHGYRLLGEYYAKAMHRVLREKKEWKPLMPISVIQHADSIVLELNPVGSLVFDNVYQAGTLPMRPFKGFEYFDSSQSTDIKSVAIKGKYIIITLTKAPEANNKRLRYAYSAYDFVDAATDNAARGNVHDSDSLKGYYTQKPLYNWLVHFDKPLAESPIVWGCTDSAFQGYSSQATLSDSTLCGEIITGSIPHQSTQPEVSSASQGLLYMYREEPFEISIYDLKGNLHFNASGKTKTTYNLRSLPSGIYFLKTKSGGISSTQKLFL
ncbi:MAG: T9SS type A sorting domain-containing protein [Fibrobacteria bacterium]|nr:T9SS type A sorting domain-containing protein [Fibrobacteria bacterium]